MLYSPKKGRTLIHFFTNFYMKKIITRKKTIRTVKKIILPKLCPGKTSIKTGTGTVLIAGMVPTTSERNKALALAKKDLAAKLQRTCKLRSKACRCELKRTIIVDKPVYRVLRRNGKFGVICTIQGIGVCGCSK